jgi:prolyl oligopeptidase
MSAAAHIRSGSLAEQRLKRAARDLSAVTVSVAVYLRDARHRVLRFDAAGADLGEVDLADAGQHSAGSVSELHADQDSQECFLGIESFLRSTRAYRVDLATGQAEPLALTDMTAPAPDARIERRSATSADGTTVPYFLLRPAGAGQPLPTVRYGYGGYDNAITPTFKAAWPAWLTAGGAVAVANLRGGGEYGRQWHEAGQRDRKQNVFDELVPGRLACAVTASSSTPTSWFTPMT